MRELVPQLAELQLAHEPFAMATVIEARSTPLGAGATVAVDGEGRTLGAVAGGCIEAAVVTALAELLEEYQSDPDGAPRARPWRAEGQLSCHGTIRLHMQVVSRHHPWDFSGLATAAAEDRPAACAVVTDGRRLGRGMTVLGPEVKGTLGDKRLDDVATGIARELAVGGGFGLHHWDVRWGDTMEAVEVLVVGLPPRPRLLVIGAVNHTGALVRLAAAAGYRVTVCDHRSAFAVTWRFPEADEVIVEWPHRYLASIALDSRTSICMLTHDANLEARALAVALQSPVGYIGAMGSRRTHRERVARLRSMGVGRAVLSRINAPIGLDLGGCAPEDTALAILCEIARTRNGGSGQPLSRLTGPIHVRGTPLPGGLD